jgi:hypothetical protein
LAGVTSGCGTIIYPERVGQPRGGPLDWKIVALDTVGLVLFVVPGAIAFAVDWYNGTLFLPEYGYGAAPPDKQRLRSVPLQRSQLSRSGLEEAIREQTGRTVLLEPGTYRTKQIERLEDFPQLVESVEQEWATNAEDVRGAS